MEIPVIDKKYKINSHGKYHKGICDCPYCYYEPEDLPMNICGFNESRIGLLTVVECPMCFEKWSFHCRQNDGFGGWYTYFIHSIELNKNKHFNEEIENESIQKL